jgi:uncharacterized protein (TIGR02265 family)
MTVYYAPSWDAPFDAEAYLRTVPPGAMIKGLFGATVSAAAKQRKLTLKRAAEKYLPFLDYPLVDHNRLLLECATTFWPDLPVRQGLRKIGRAAMASLLETTFGKALLGGLTQPDTVALALGSLAKAFATTLSKPTPLFEVIETGDRSALLRLRDSWTFLDSQQVGIIEGLGKLCGVRVEVRLAIESPGSAEYSCSWEPAAASQAPPNSARGYEP